jgi:hypothetical protein
MVILKNKKIQVFRLSRNLSRIKKIGAFNKPKELAEGSMINALLYSEGLVMFDYSTHIVFFHMKRKEYRNISLAERPRLIRMSQETSQLLVVSKYHCLLEFDLNCSQSQLSPKKVLDSFDWKILDIFLDSPKKVILISDPGFTPQISTVGHPQSFFVERPHFNRLCSSYQ